MCTIAQHHMPQLPTLGCEPLLWCNAAAYSAAALQPTTPSAIHCSPHNSATAGLAWPADAAASCCLTGLAVLPRCCIRSGAHGSYTPGRLLLLLQGPASHCLLWPSHTTDPIQPTACSGLPTLLTPSSPAVHHSPRTVSHGNTLGRAQ